MQQIRRIRSFNRIVAEPVDAVYYRFPGRDRSTGESRLLWEIVPLLGGRTSAVVSFAEIGTGFLRLFQPTQQ